MGRIKLAFFADVLIRDFDGCLRTVFHIIDRIDTDRFEVQFFCGSHNEEDNLPFVAHSIPNVRLPMNKSYNMALPFLAKRKLDKLLEEYNPDVIHFTSPSPLGNYALNYGKKNNIPVTSIYHTHFISYVDYYFSKVPALIPWGKKTVSSVSRSIYNSCSKIFVPTLEMIEDLRTQGVRTDNMLLWPRGINKDIFSPLNKNPDFLRNYTGNSNYNLLFASRLVWEKNLKTLIKIYRRIESQKLPYNLIIAGHGSAAEELKKKMPNAFFTGTLSQKELALHYASADAFVFPSISETYGNVVIEAMASGLPCVIANGGGSKSFIEHGENGFLCEAFNPNSYLKNIDQILSSLELRYKFRLNGLKFVRNLDWDSLVVKYFSELEKLSFKKSESVIDPMAQLAYA